MRAPADGRRGDDEFDSSSFARVVVKLGLRMMLMESIKTPELSQAVLPADTAWLFPEYAFSTMDVQSCRGVIIERVLERGSWQQASWLFATYGETDVAQWVSRHGFRLLSKRSFALWRLTLDIETFEAPDWAIAAKRSPESW